VYGRKYFSIHHQGHNSIPEARVKKGNTHRSHNQAQPFIKYPIIESDSTNKVVKNAEFGLLFGANVNKLSYDPVDTTSNCFVGYYIDLINKCIGTDYKCVKTNRWSNSVYVLYGSKREGKLEVYYDTIAFETKLYSCVIGCSRLTIYKKGHTYNLNHELINIKGNSAIRRVMTEGMIDKLIIKDKSNDTVL
jgi:hypothetical protein